MIATLTATNQAPVDTQTICRPTHQSKQTGKPMDKNSLKIWKRKYKNKEE
jgi:hypothetical protein